MSWILEGKRVQALYLGEIPVDGIVVLSRVKYDGGVAHTIKLDLPINPYGDIRDHVIVDRDNITNVYE